MLTIPEYNEAFAQLASIQQFYTDLCNKYDIGIVATALNLRVETVEVILGFPNTTPGVH